MAREDIEALLPFYANGTLSEAERAEVEAVLADDPTLEIELSALRAMREHLQSEEPRSPGEFGLARLMRDVDREGRAGPETPTRRVPAWFWQAAAALALVALLAQSLFMYDSGAPGYQLAGDADGAVVVAFDPDATEAAIRALLNELGLEIVGGPSALGLYQVADPSGEVTEADLEALRDAPLVESADRND
jgi:anti-sigma factor RsiW